MARTNNYPGRCRVCDTHVPERAGYIERKDGRWVTYCSSSKCLPPHIMHAVKTADMKKLTADGLLICPKPDSAGMALIKGCPGARWCPARNPYENPNTGKMIKVPEGRPGVWVVSTELKHRRRLLEVAEALGLEVADDLVTDELDPLAQAAKDRAEAGVIDPKTGAHLKGYDYQVEGCTWLAALDNAILADDMGLGKTPQALFAMDPSKGWLVVVPASVKLNWQRECRRWRPDLNPRVLEGRKSWEDPESWPAPGEVWILNPDIMPKWLSPTREETATLRNGKRIKWKVADVSELAAERASNVGLVADEVHLYKNRKTIRAKRMKELRRLCAVAWGLTGTPLENRPFDLWGILDVFGVAKAVFGTWNRFMNLFGAMENQWGGYDFAGEPAEEVPERLRRIMLRRLKSEVLTDLPPKTYAELEVPLRSKKLRRALDKMYDVWGDTLEEGDLPPFEEFSKLRAELAEDRIPAMLEIVESHEESETPLLVFSYHKAPIMALKDREGWATITGETSNERRDEIVEQFQAGELKGVGLTIRAAGVGLTLTRASHSLFVDLDWVPTWNTQAEDRIHRISQESNFVLITRMYSNHPLDLHVHKLLAEKTALIYAAIERTHDKAEFADLNLPGITEISEEEHAEKLAKLEEAIRRAAMTDIEKLAEKVRESVPVWKDSMRKRASLPEVELTDEIKPVIRQAFSYMLSICDGAKEEDGMGFNKPDAAISRLLVAHYGLDSDDSLRLAERMLSRYHRQLHGVFPDLFVWDAKFKGRPQKPANRTKKKAAAKLVGLETTADIVAAADPVVGVLPAKNSLTASALFDRVVLAIAQEAGFEAEAAVDRDAVIERMKANELTHDELAHNDAKHIKRRIGFAFRNQREKYCGKKTPLTVQMGRGEWALTEAGVERAKALQSEHRRAAGGR